ncbi:hypothetical protein ABZ468_07835 [Streptomyces sp. NPDC005708]|uniref:hypothetical protein n=1 Tax=Streptomyces sp. NPDC005708 TaxID=3154564 RepID=UPI0033CE57E3
MPGITAPQRPRQSRKPTNKPNPPMILLAGPEKSGKSFEAALGTGSDLIGMSYWIEIGGSEGTADYYGRVPGARYEIVEHDGTYQDILDAVRWAVAQPPVDGKPNMIVLDNVSVLWDMLSDEQALFARWRAERKAQEQRRRGPNPDLPVTVDPDLWNRAKDRWGEILWMLRRHSGPTLLLARQEMVTAFENDKPTRDQVRKIKAEKNLPAAVDAIVELHALGEAHLTGVRTLHWEVKPGESTRFPDFSVDALLRRLGFEDAAAARQVTEARPEAYLDEQHQAQQQQRQGRQQQGQGRQQQQQRAQQRPQQDQRAAQGAQKPELTSERAAKLIRDALADQTNPEMCLQGIREEWGIRTLQQLPTKTAWGEMNADDLITRSLEYAKGRALQKQQGGTGQHGEQSGPGGEDQARGHHGHEEQAPADDSDAPPPPDPQAEPELPAESPEDTSAAEEPQDLPPARPAAAAPQQKRRSRAEQMAYGALMDEADVQARLKFITVGEHLGPISETGDPTVMELRDFLQACRPGAIGTLETVGESELADYYRNAPMPDLQIGKRFAAFFESAPSSS